MGQNRAKHFQHSPRAAARVHVSECPVPVEGTTSVGSIERKKELKRRRHRRVKVAQLKRRVDKATASEKAVIAEKIRRLTPGGEAIVGPAGPGREVASPSLRIPRRSRRRRPTRISPGAASRPGPAGRRGLSALVERLAERLGRLFQLADGRADGLRVAPLATSRVFCTAFSSGARSFSPSLSAFSRISFSSW